ncbi:hypothetical protein BCR32DRAFT_240290 [Anaeromyces robustus]|uniref:Uncharacterized protein n=1 Tax=Anaeromyces robustus TaxID=1754192 RepID=A0A1Y1XNJ3_9FUNG|nr:hypothetical protein BCR32DRAFT_240290 [Anaeromyces robustus]|eukprot:ORX87302.1 hypothetical protein BCR32DRAFT_240290 [Anaeromyces robustus]
MGAYMEQLKKVISNETIKTTKTIKKHSFRIICNSLIKYLDEGKLLYVEQKLDHSYIKYMVVVNIFYDVLPNLKDFNKEATEYRILTKEIDTSINTIKEIKSKLIEKDALSTTNSQSNLSNSRSSSTDDISSPRVSSRKTIAPDKMYSYIARMTSNKETSPPQILLIDIRDRKNYENGHIHWSANPYLKYSGVINIPIGVFFG